MRKWLSLIGVSVMLIGCSQETTTDIVMSEQVYANEKFKETALSIGDKLVFDNDLEIIESVAVSNKVHTEIAYLIQEEIIRCVHDQESGHDHVSSLTEGDKLDHEVDYDALGIPVTPVEEVEETVEEVQQSLEVSLVDTSFYTERVILKYSNQANTVGYIIEIIGDEIKGVVDIEVYTIGG